MQIATVMVALGGDAGNTVQKYEVTPSEVVLLQLIHGNEAVTEIEPVGTVPRSSRIERARLLEVYGQNQPDGPKRCPQLDALFPGIAARLFERFDELELDPSNYKTATRVQADWAPTASAVPIEPAAAAGEDEDDGIADMPPIKPTVSAENVLG